MNVKQIQANLTLKGYGPLAIDGDLGPKTREAIKSFQAANKLEVDGDPGPYTLALILTPIKGDLARRAMQILVSQVGVKEVGNNSGPEVEMYLKSVGLGKGFY